MAASGFYQLTPLRFGAEIRNIQLSSKLAEKTVQQIKHDVTQHRLLIFKDQGLISGSEQVQISKWFGELESTFYKHPKSPHPDVFRVSNSDYEGCTGVGRTGWHIDGSFQQQPFSHSLYHIVSVPLKGDTVFVPLNEIVNGLDESKRARWERLWMLSDRRSNIVHPLVYPHPLSGKQTMCFHLGMTEAFIFDYDSTNARVTKPEETRQILKEIHHEFVKNDKALQYSHKWEAGDFIISDNLAVGHEASADTQLPVHDVGLRVMHRTTVKGQHTPRKHEQVT